MMALAIIVVAINMFRLNPVSFCQPDTFPGEPGYGHVRYRYRYRNRDRMANFEVDTDSEPDTDPDDSDAFMPIRKPPVGTKF